MRCVAGKNNRVCLLHTPKGAMIMELKDIDFSAMPEKAIIVITNPAGFFQSMEKTGGYMEPLAFAVIMGGVAGVIQAIMGIFGLGAGFINGFVSIIKMPIIAGVGSFIGAAILFVIWKFMGSVWDYEVSYRSCAYMMALWPITAIVSIIPYAGMVINTALALFYTVMASVHVHRLPAEKAWLVFGIIFAVLLLLSLVAGRFG